ncbi:hypothetical protein [Christensenella massiliensis]|uniref:Phage MuF C-terminal domain-containing protein n=1 Tax=Christensenella massiliensis TaxID=1805714 RepID=A0AAU8A7F8_9FIRM
MAKTKAQREAEERLRKNNERIYRETGYDPDGWRERTAEIARTERNFAQPSRPKKQKNFTYLKNTKRNAQDRERNIDPYAWQNRDYGTQEDDDGFRWDFGLTGLFGMLAEKKKREEEKADKADPTKSGQYTQAKQEIMKPFEEKVSSAEQEEEAARKEADTLENLIFTKAKGYGTGAGQGYAAAQNNVFASEGEKAENAARLTSALAGQSGKTQEAEQKAADAKGKGAATAAAKALRDQAEKQVDKEIYTIDIQNDAKREEYTQKGREADSKLKKELDKGTTGQALAQMMDADDRRLAYFMISKEEADVYFALNGKYGEEVANRYLDSLMPELEARAAGMLYENVEGIDNEALKKIARWGVTVGGAAGNVGRNLKNLPAAITGSDEVAAPGVFQQAQGMIGENLEGIEKAVHDVTDSTVNMLPSIAMGFIPGVGPAAAAGMTAATSYSNAYTDAILSGYEPGQAAAYALPSAASEALMQYAIGGVAKMGGSKSLTNTVQKAMDDVIKNPAARNVLGKAAQAGGEALEEYLQANLDPVLRNLALGENNEIDPVSEDKAYAALLGAVMGGAIDAVGDAANIPARRSAQRAQDAAYVRQGVHEALNDAIVEQTAAEARANAILDKTGVQRAYDPSETVKLASGTEAVVVARDGNSYVVQEPGKQGYSRVSADSITGKVQSASPQADRSIAPEARAALNEKYDHRHVEKLADQAFLDKLEQGRGIKAVIEDMQPGAEAFYDRSTNTIHFAPDSTRADVIGGVAAHELSHAAEASEHYKAYSDYALQRLFGNDAEALQQAIEAKQEQYVRHGVYLSDADAMAEIVADYTRNLYKSPADIDALVTGNRGMAQSIYDAIRTAIQKIRAFFKGDEAALRNIREYQDLRRAQRLFERALSTIPEVQAEAAPAYAVSDVEIPTRREAGMIDITDAGNRIRYEREIDGVFDGSLPTGSEIIMGRTPEILTLYGAPDLPLHMTQATVRKIAYPEGYHGGKHNLGIQAVKDLPDQLVDPIAILINKSHPNNSVVVISEWNDVDGNRVIVPIQFNRQGAITVQNQITSAFGREDMSQYLGKDNENVIYTKNNEDIQSLLSHGRQLPEASRDDVFVTDIIPQTEEDVNRQYSLRENGASLDDLKKQRSEMIRQAREAADRGIADQTDISSVIGAERAVADERLRQQKAAYEERTARDRMRRKESGERSQLLNIVRRLDKLSKKSAPEQKNAIQNLIKDIDKTAKGITRKGTLTLKAIKAGYEEAAQDLNFIKNPAIEKKIARLDQKHIADMDISDVRELTDILRGVEHDIRSANREVGIRKAKVISELSEKGISEIRNSRGASGNAFLSLFNSSSLSPTRRFAQMGGWREGSVMEYLGEQLAEGQRKAMEFRRDASGKFQDFIGQNGKVFDDWSGKKAKWIDTGLSKNGKMLQITPAMRISLYLHSLNADNMRHIAGGGITVPDQKLYKQGKIAEAYSRGTVARLTPQKVKAITDRMTPQEKEFADLAYEFFNADSKKAINSASLDVLGYEIANVENYMPITANRAFTKGEFENLVKDGTLEGMGMLKERENAANPIMLEDITSIIPRHMGNAARYYGLAVPIRNFNEVYRRTTDGFGDSVQNAIGNKFGKKGTEYIEKLMTDLQGGGRNTDTAFDKMRGKFAQAILGFNAGSALKQTASLPTAASTLGFKAVLGSMRGRVDSARIDANTPLLWERRQGGSTLEIGDVARNRNWEDKVPFLMKWNQSMDVAIAKRLWRAAEIYVNGHYKSLERGSAEYDAEVARWYNKAIEDTQSNYATMQRPDILRSENQMIKALTMFTTDRFQMYNILYEAGGRLRTAKEDYKADPNAENRAAVKKYAQQLARSVAAVTASNAWVAAVTIGINLLLGRQDWYEDEEGDLALAESFGSEFLRNMAGTLPFGDQIYSLIASAVSDETWYGVEAPNIGMINDLAEDVINMAKSISDGGDAAIRRNAKALAMDAAKFFGIPAENIEKYVLGIAGQVAPAVKESYDNIFYPNDLGDLAEAEGREYDAIYDTVITNRMNGIKGTDAYEEIKDLYRAMGEGTDRNSMFLPAVPDKVEYTPEGGEKAEYELTAEEQKQYAETQNKVFADAVNALISSKDYAKLDNEQKGYAVSVIAGMAKDDAKAEALDTKGITMERSRTAILKPEDIALYKAVVMDYGAEGKTAQDERNALLRLDISEERKAEVYRAVFENQNTEQNGIMRARGQGVGTETYIAFMAQPFWNDETRDDSAGGENLQAKQWLLDNAAEEEIVPLYEMKLESNDMDERSTIAYAQEQGVRPSAFVKREIQKAGEHGLPGAPEEDAIWEDGKMVTDEHGSIVSGSKKAQACDNLLKSGYTEEEKEYFYQKEYGGDDYYVASMLAGIPIDAYLSRKAAAMDLTGEKDENGKTVSGSKKEDIREYIYSLDIPDVQKSFLFAQEYKIYGSEAQAVREYVDGLDVSDAERELIYSKLKLGGGSGGSSGGRRRSGGSSKAASQAIPDSVWNTLRSNVKAPGVPDNPVFAALLSMAEEHDSIMRAAMERDIAAVEANPFISNEAKAAQKKKIRERYGKGAVS